MDSLDGLPQKDRRYANPVSSNFKTLIAIDDRTDLRRLAHERKPTVGVKEAVPNSHCITQLTPGIRGTKIQAELPEHGLISIDPFPVSAWNGAVLHDPSPEEDEHLLEKCEREQ